MIYKTVQAIYRMLLISAIAVSLVPVVVFAQNTTAESGVAAPVAKDSLSSDTDEQIIASDDFPMPATRYVEITRPLPETAHVEQVGETRTHFSLRMTVLAVLTAFLLIIIVIRNILSAREPAFHETAERVLDDIPEKQAMLPIDPTGFEIVEEEEVSCDLSTPFGKASSLKVRRKVHEREIKRLLTKL